jgi:molybdate transport system ATP-binding protein
VNQQTNIPTNEHLNSAATNHVGINSAGKNHVGINSAGKNHVGINSAGKTSAGKNHVGVDITIAVETFTMRAAFSVREGITVLFGPSGSGKSITLQAIAGLVRPVEGSIEIAGRIVADPQRGIHIPTQDRQIGMVTQHSTLFPHLSPIDNVALAILARHHTSEAPEISKRKNAKRAAKAEAREWLSRVHATHLCDARNTRALSGGEHQRVALARAFAGTPKLLLLDEPFSALDRKSRENLRNELRMLVAEYNCPAIVVTHDVDDVLTLANRIILVERGTTLDQFDCSPGDARTVQRIINSGS